jgi:hypothetical protein
MRLRIFFVLVLVFVLPLLAVNAYADAFLATAGNFAVLGGSTVTNTLTPFTNLTGDLGVWPGTAITNQGEINVNGTTAIANPAVHATDAVAMQAQSDATTAYNALTALTPAGGPLGDNLTSQVVGVGVYDLGAALLDSGGVLTLNFAGASNANIVFRTASTLTTGSGSSVVIENANSTDNVFWQIGSSATLGTTTAFAGNIIALTSVTLDTGATDLCGSVIARNGAVTMDQNTISNTCQFTGGEMIGGGTGGGPGVPGGGGGSGGTVPEPGTLALLSSGLAIGLLKLRKLR